MPKNCSRRRPPIVSLALASLFCSTLSLHGQTNTVLTGQAAFTDYSQEKPGVTRKLTVADLPAPFATKSVDNGPPVSKRPDGAWPQAPAGFKVEQYATGLVAPRLIRKAPTGEIGRA